MQIPDEWCWDYSNSVLACAACNGFCNRYKASLDGDRVISLDEFYDTRDRIFLERKELISARHDEERKFFAQRSWEAIPVRDIRISTGSPNASDESQPGDDRVLPIGLLVSDNIAERTQREVVLEVGAEGGSITLVRERHGEEDWKFWVHTDESSMADLLDDDDLAGMGSLSSKTSGVHAFSDAMTLLDGYPWITLAPLYVHPDFLDFVLAQVRKCGGEAAETRWQTELGSRSQGRFPTPL
jgi:hypothetical protein